MLIHQLTVPELQAILNNNSGIINADTDILSLERQLIDFNQIFLQSFSPADIPEYNINIEDFKRNIQQYLQEGLTHLGIYYGLESNDDSLNNRNNIRLIITGAKLNNDNPKRILRSSESLFSDANFSLSQNSSPLNNQRANFKNTLIQQQLVNYNHGLYIRLDDLLSKLTELEALSFDELNIRLGFRPADVIGFWNCIHLIFRGSSFGTPSEILFSTFDANDPAYDGPKLGILPFGELDIS